MSEYKIIIKNRSHLDDIGALELVGEVIDGGRISGEAKSYCYVTVFPTLLKKVIVRAQRNKASDTFIVDNY